MVTRWILARLRNVVLADVHAADAAIAALLPSLNATRTTVDAGLDVGTKGLQFGLPEGCLFFKQTEAFADDARALIAARVELLTHESLEVMPGWSELWR